MEKYLDIVEAASLLRVSRHTVQAWMSPSSPNHRPEFAAIARHAGRKSLFAKEDVLAWVEQRRGAMYAQTMPERSTYWRERFLAARGSLKGILRPGADRTFKTPVIMFNQGMLALDSDPLISWLLDDKGANFTYKLVSLADGLVVAVPMVLWLLRKASRNTAGYTKLKSFLLTDRVFELAPLSVEALNRYLELPVRSSDLSLQNYCCCITHGAGAFLTSNKTLSNQPGLPVISFSE